MTSPRPLFIAATALLAALSTLITPTARAADVDSPTLMVATPRLTGPYAQTVIIAIPAGGDHHLGLVLNRPTQAKLAALLPDHPPAKQLDAPVFMGGPALNESLFALVRSTRAPGKGSHELVPGLYMVFSESALDRVIDGFPGEARFFVGLVAWDAGELEAEVAEGAWYLMRPDIDFVMDGSAETLWARLITQLRAVVALAQ